VLGFLADTLTTGSLHARYVAANALRRMSWQPSYADLIVAANVLPALIQIARKPRILIDAPAATGVGLHGRRLSSVAVCCGVLWCVAVCCSVLKKTKCCSVLQCAAVCCRLSSVAVCCSALQYVAGYLLL